MRWIYLRKKSSEGEFDIYTDIDSKIKHSKRINLLWSSLMWIEFLVGLLNVAIGIINMNSGNNEFFLPNLNFIVGSLAILSSLVFFTLGSPVRRKIKRLKKEKLVRE
jgi:hypothetical protein